MEAIGKKKDKVASTNNAITSLLTTTANTHVPAKKALKQAVFFFTQQAGEHEKFQVGCPLPQGMFFTTDPLSLINEQGDGVSANIKPIQLWPDLSIKWVSIEGVLNIPFARNEALYISKEHPKTTLKRSDWVKQSQNQLCIETANGTVLVQLDKFLEIDVCQNVSVAAHLEIEKMGSLIAPTATDVNTQFEVVFTNLQEPLLCKITQSASINLNGNHETQAQKQANSLAPLRVHANSTIYFADTAILTNVSVHNPNAIVHHNGQWDLGNENSIKITRFAVDLAYRSQKQTAALQVLKQNTQQNLREYDVFELVQFSSGGNNWNSENHVTSDNKVKLKHKGAKGKFATADKIDSIQDDRPSPLVHLHINDNVLSVCPQHFWQKYPTGIYSDKHCTTIDFADNNSGCDVEVQPGEIKSHNIALSYGKAHTHAGLTMCSHFALCVDNLEQSRAKPFINKHLCEHPLMQAVSGNGEVNWLAKREQVDEYGWRNFGDLYADHEAAGYEGEGIFVSHYNNQYDPLFGFVKQWLLTQDPSFKELAQDLFDHIIHIDIYHTDQDKPEYNQGLFWHTDHYVPAKTATHRTYSELQETGVYMDHAGGGGPGSHHCYSSGLALYYLMTGDERAKRATVGLGQWMRYIYEGDNTLLGFVLQMKNANSLTIPFTQKLLLGGGTGIARNPFNNSYPLDRGTGNYVNVMLDCFETTLQKSYIEHAQYIILNTISEHDDIQKRNFADIENTWYYVVLLQAVAKYLAIVSQQITHTSPAFVDLNKLTAIRNAFIHYALWMAENEQPYLANKDVLEYPNDTWTGQDLRKIHVLLCGYELTKSQAMLNKAHALSTVIYPALLASTECTYTRIQALIMQNYGNEKSIQGSFNSLVDILSQHAKASKHKQSTFKVNKSYVARSLAFIKAYSLKKEINMLCVRIPSVKKWLKR